MPIPPDYPRVPPPPPRKTPATTDAGQNRAIRQLERGMRNTQTVTRNSDGRYQVTATFSHPTETSHLFTFQLPRGRWLTTVGVVAGVTGAAPGFSFSTVVAGSITTVGKGPNPFNAVSGAGGDALTVGAPGGPLFVSVETDATGFDLFSVVVTIDAIGV